MNLCALADWSLLIFRLRIFALKITDIISDLYGKICNGNKKYSRMWILSHQTTHVIDKITIVL